MPAPGNVSAGHVGVVNLGLVILVDVHGAVRP